MTRVRGGFVSFFKHLFLFAGVLALFTTPVEAGQPLSFGSKIGETSRQALQGYIATSLGQSLQNLDIAPVDLNNDGLNEFILKTKACDSQNQPCRFLVLSETGDSITLLGDMEGRKINVDSGAVQGVRNLMVYKNGTNDYEYTVYVWEPQAGRYMIAEDK